MTKAGARARKRPQAQSPRERAHGEIASAIAVLDLERENLWLSNFSHQWLLWSTILTAETPAIVTRAPTATT